MRHDNESLECIQKATKSSKQFIKTPDLPFKGKSQPITYSDVNLSSSVVDCIEQRTSVQLLGCFILICFRYQKNRFCFYCFRNSMLSVCEYFH